MRDIASPLDGFRSPFGNVADPFAVLGFRPEYVTDFEANRFRANSASTTFDSAMTHSRSGNATMVDSDGLLKWAPHNLLTYSEQFDNVVWPKNNVTIVANDAISPIGDSTADLIYPTTTGAPRRLLRDTNSLTNTGTTYTQAIWVKSAGFQWVHLNATKAAAPDDSCWFDVVNGTLGTQGANAVASSITDAGNGWWLISVSGTADAANNYFYLSVCDADNSFTATTNGTDGLHIWGAHLYRSDLGGMVNNPDRGDSYVPTTSAARYLARRNHHVWNGSAWVKEGVLIEPSAATNLLLNSGTLSTQTVTVTAAPHTLHFTGTGTVTLLGASTAGPLVGTGAGEQNRVSLTFTPTAGSLTLIVSGTVTNAQLEAGSVPTSYSPTAGSTATRAAETLTVPANRLPSSGGMPAAVSIQMQGRMTYADEGTATVARLLLWNADGSNRILYDIDTIGGETGEVQFYQQQSVTGDRVTSSPTAYTPGVNVPFNIASRHGSTFINGAVDGTALTTNTTPVALPDLSATNLQLAFSGGPMILSKFRMWAADLGDEGIAEASS